MKKKNSKHKNTHTPNGHVEKAATGQGKIEEKKSNKQTESGVKINRVYFKT